MLWALLHTHTSILHFFFLLKKVFHSASWTTYPVFVQYFCCIFICIKEVYLHMIFLVTQIFERNYVEKHVYTTCLNDLLAFFILTFRILYLWLVDRNADTHSSSGGTPCSGLLLHASHFSRSKPPAVGLSIHTCSHTHTHTHTHTSLSLVLPLCCDHIPSLCRITSQQWQMLATSP